MPAAFASDGNEQKENQILQRMQETELQKQSPGFCYDAQALKQLNKVKKQKAGKDYVSDEVIISVGSREEAKAAAIFYNADVKNYNEHGIALLKLKQGETVASTLEKGLNITDMAPNRIYSALETVQYTPSDPDYGLQYCHTDMNNIGAWDTTKGAGVTVAVIDTGIDTGHEEFSGRISPLSYNSRNDQIGTQYVVDDIGHGTHVSGIIAAAQDNGLGGCGVAPEATIMAIKANEPGEGSFYEYSIIRGIYYAADNGASIINLSLGSPYDDGPSTAEHKAIQDANGKGVLVVCAAGNKSDNHAGYPAAYEECVAVSALQQDNIFDDTYSNYGPEIDISAPGTNIYNTFPVNAYGSLSGTSMAAPQVSGVAALIKANLPSITVDEIKQKLYTSAVDKGVAGKDSYYGYGAVNACNVLAATLHTVTFDAAGGTNAPPPIKATHNYGITKPESPTKNGYKFVGWYKESQCLNPWNFATDVVSSDITLYAKWTKNAYSVTFHSNGGSPVNSLTVGYMDVIPEPPDPVFDGYVFCGWYRNSNFNELWDFVNSKVTGNVDLYAGWAADEPDGPPPTPVNLKVSSVSYKSIGISWNDGEYARGYEIYRSSSFTGFYSLIADVSDSFFTDSSLMTNKTYYYKVRAYTEAGEKTLYSGFTNAIYAKTVPSAPGNIKAFSAGKKRMKVIWSRVGGAKKYELYYATSPNGRYKKIATTGSLSYTKKGLKKGRTYYYKVKAYYYKVKAYCLLKGKKVYGGFSEPAFAVAK